MKEAGKAFEGTCHHQSYQPSEAPILIFVEQFLVRPDREYALVYLSS